MSKDYEDDDYAEHEYSDMPEGARELHRELNEMHGGAALVIPRKVLEEGGYAVPPPESLSDDELSLVLKNVIEGLSLLNVFLHHTDHLSDRALYEYLWAESLAEPTVIFPKDRRGSYHIDLIGSGSDEDIDIALRFYDSDEERDDWIKRWGGALPPKETPPFDRDRFLPKHEWVIDEPVEN